jgi:molybdopterin synthase catalytic subunit
MIGLTAERLDPGTVAERLSIPRGSGSVVVHFAVAKSVVGARRTAGIRFSPAGDPEAELRALESELRAKWEAADVLLLRRTGEVRVGDVISVAAIAAPGRNNAFGACRDAVDGFKEMKGLLKEELFEDGGIAVGD